jgi:zinc/manganese transport system permease protein
MMINTSGLDLSILAPAFAAGIIVLLTHVVLGREVLQRGIIFIDLAIAQFAGLGIIFADTVGIDAHGWTMQGIAFSSAACGALLLGAAERYLGKYQEALIGITFVLASTGSILLLANNPHGGEQLKDLLVGQILWVDWSQLVVPLLASLAIAALWFLKRALFKGRFFYILFAIAITLSVQLIGVYLVFASLIIPALVTAGFNDSKAVIIALLLGIAGYASGLLLSALFDLPSGAMIVWSLAGVALLFAVIRKGKAR